jgi:outer membrane receptor protein involved in Fe transport
MRTNRIKFFAALLVLLFIATSLSVMAQTSRGTVTGTVTDSSGAVVSNASVRLKQTSTNVTRETVSNGAGVYRFDAVDLGTYDLTVQAGGFKSYSVKALDVTANQAVTINAAMQVSNGSGEFVTVEGTAIAALQVTDERRGENLNEIAISQLPVLGQNSLNLMLTLPGVVQSSLGGSLDSGIGAINGSRARSNNFLLNGIDNNDISVAGAVNTITNQDAFQEVSIQTSNFSAEFGRAGGAVINQIIKSGSNSLHGSAAWLYRSQRFDATALPQRSAAGPTATNAEIKPSYKENIPAFTLGGPVYIPGIYNGHDKTFFFVAGQWDRFSSGASTSVFSNVPTPSGLATLQSLAAACPNVQLYLNSLQGITSPTATPNAISIALPSATGSCNGSARTGQTVGFGPANRIVPSVQIGNNHQVKLDHTVSTKQFMSFNYNWNDFDGGIASAGISPLFDALQTNRQLSGSFTDTYIISPSLTNEFRFSYGRAHLDVPIASAVGSTLQRFTITGLSSFGTSTTFPQGRVSNNWQYQDTVSVVRGRHSLRTGVEILRQLARQYAPSNNRGTLAYGSSTGITGLANFIDDFSGASGTITQQFGSPIYRPNLFRWTLFAQDSWRLSSDFTLNLGLRYENFGQPANIFTFPAFSGNDPTQFAVPSHVNADNNNFGPSVGFAWNPHNNGGLFSRLTGDGKLVLRGGYQVSYDTFFNNLLSNIAAGAPNNPSNLTLTAPAGRGFAGLRSTILPTVAVAALNPLGGSASQFDPNIRNPYVHRFSLGVQRELPGKMLIDVSYIGSLGRKLFETLSTNPTLPNAALNSAGARLNPAFGARTIRASSATSNYNAMQVEVRRQFAETLIGKFQFTSAYTWSRNMDQVSEAFVTNQANSSTPASNPYLFPGGISGEYGPSDNDRRHLWNSTFVWDVRGPKTGVLGQALGGWRLASIIPVSSGQPYTVVDGIDRDLDGSSAGDRPEIGNINAPINTRANSIVPTAACPTGLINPDLGNACTTAGAVHFISTLQTGQAGVQSYSVPGANTERRNAQYTQGNMVVHLNVSKTFSLSERFKFEYRAEIFNVLNQQSFNFAPFLSGGASTVLVQGAASGNFLNFGNGNSAEFNGLGATYSSRNMRMGVKLTF